MTVRSGIFMSRQVAFSATLRWVSMTPLLFPVVPDVNMIVHSWSGSGVIVKAPSDALPAASGSRSTCIVRDALPAAWRSESCAAAGSGLLRHRPPRPSSPRRRRAPWSPTARIRSHTSSAGRFTSSGTTTLPLSTVPKVGHQPLVGGHADDRDVVPLLPQVLRRTQLRSSRCPPAAVCRFSMRFHFYSTL